jgi:hypothetical protein
MGGVGVDADEEGGVDGDVTVGAGVGGEIEAGGGLDAGGAMVAGGAIDGGVGAAGVGDGGTGVGGVGVAAGAATMDSRAQRTLAAQVWPHRFARERVRFEQRRIGRNGAALKRLLLQMHIRHKRMSLPSISVLGVS